MQDSTIESLISGMVAGLSGLPPLIEESTETMGSVRSLLGDVSEKIIPVDVLSSVIPPSSDAVKSPVLPTPVIQADAIALKSRDATEKSDSAEDMSPSTDAVSGNTYITNNNYYSSSSSADTTNTTNNLDKHVSNNSASSEVSSVNYVDRSENASEISNSSITRISGDSRNVSSVGGDTITLKASDKSSGNAISGEANQAEAAPTTTPQVPVRVEVVLPHSMQPSAASMNSYVDSSGNTVTYVSGSASRIEGGSFVSNSQSVVNARSESSTSNINNNVTTKQDVYTPRGESVEKSYYSDRESRDSEIRELVKEIHIKSAESAPDMSGEIISAIQAMASTISQKLDQLVIYGRAQAKQHNEMIQ